MLARRAPGDGSCERRQRLGFGVDGQRGRPPRGCATHRPRRVRLVGNRSPLASAPLQHEAQIRLAGFDAVETGLRIGRRAGGGVAVLIEAGLDE